MPEGHNRSLAKTVIVAGLVLLLFTPGGCTPAGPVVLGLLAYPETAGDVPVDRQVHLLFDQAMDATTLEAALTLVPEPPNGYTATMSDDGTTLILAPHTLWHVGTTYQITLSPVATNAQGRRLRGQYQASFTTRTPREVQCHSPRYSPSGQWLAWVEETPEGWQAWIVEPAADTDPQLVYDNLWPHSQVEWLDEATLLLVLGPDANAASPRPATLQLGGQSPAEMPLQLVQPGRITYSPSPDGTYIVVQNDMYLADAHSDYHRQLILATRDGVGFHDIGNLLLGWGQSSSYVLWLDLPGIGEGHSFDYTLYSFDLATQTSRPVPQAPRINNAGQAARSPDGQSLAFGTWLAEEVATADGLEIRRLPQDIWLIGTDGHGLRRLTLSQGRNGDVRWLGQQSLIWSSDRTGQGWDVWLMPQIGDPAGQLNLTTRTGYDGQPKGSPKGDAVAYVSDASGTREIWIMAADGRDRRLISVR